MLVLSRRCNEKIVLDDQSSIEILTVSPGNIRVRVKAPADVVVHRREPSEDDSLDCGPVLMSDAELIYG